MIVDSLRGFSNYRDFYKGFDKVYDFIKNNDIYTLAQGRYEIDGNNVYCTVSVEQGRSLESPLLEAHDCYIDIHVLLEGSEVFGYRDRGHCNAENVNYDEVKDIVFYEEDYPDAFISLNKGGLVIFYPRDTHAPLLGEGEIKKAVFKVKV